MGTWGELLLFVCFFFKYSLLIEIPTMVDDLVQRSVHFGTLLPDRIDQINVDKENHSQAGNLEVKTKNKNH